MTALVEIRNPEELGRFRQQALYAGFEPNTLHEHHVDAHYVITAPATTALARCSLWWKETPPLANERLGVIGHYAASDAAAAAQLLQEACRHLARQGCTLAVGPMDGNTWRRYRFITERGEEPTFFLEPDNADEWPKQFSTAGFAALASYSSALTTNLASAHSDLTHVRQRLHSSSVGWRPLDKADFVAELKRIYQVSVASFTRNFLYTPLAEGDFIAQYLKVEAFVQPELTLLAERDGEPVGFAFALPDIAQAQRGQNIDTCILKTVAVLPQRRIAGLGRVLVEEIHQRAHALGYRRSIHALMHDANKSRNISADYARTIRRYTLFARRLQ